MKPQKALEDVYQKKSQLEHVLLRPDTYVGSIEADTYTSWIHDGEKMVKREISIVPGLVKIFDEILVNAADNKVRDPSMNKLSIEVKPEVNMVKVWNNGDGIPIEIHKKEHVYIPELIFGHLLTSSNYDDDERKMTGGRNGFGAKLTNIFSSEFVIETADGNKEYRQKFTHNMSQKHDPEIKPSTKRTSWTAITFYPDLRKFGMTHLDDDIVGVLRRRTYDMAGLLRDVNVFFNGEKIPIKTFEDYVDLYIGKKSEGPQRVHLQVNDRWELVVSPTEGEFRQMSFVNSICTAKGGTHVNYVVEQICKSIVEKLQKKKKTTLKNFHVKNHLNIFLKCMIENPSFDSQTKENMTTRVSEFGSKCQLPADFIDKIAKSGVLDLLLNLADLKSQQLLKKTDGTKTSRLSIEKLDDATYAGTRQSSRCTLILTEGDSAKALAVAGLSVIGRETYGVFPLRGKMLNVRDASNATIGDNREVQNLKQILGLQHNTSYETTDRLRYGHVMIMTDQDFDGSHIKGLVINFLHHCHPSLLKLEQFIQMFITPIIRVSRRGESRDFFTVPDYEAWRDSPEVESGNWKVKHYKGLGTSNRDDAKKYFSSIDFHRKDFVYNGPPSEDAIDMAFSKKRVSDRKTWLSEYVQGSHLDTRSKEITFPDFVNKELILFSKADIERSIPALMDGLKPAQRKVIYTMLTRKSSAELKVIELVGLVNQKAAYHHGDQSLSATIIGLAQNFVGANNINLLAPEGQFGTRLQGGKDAASPRYLHTELAPLARLLFNDLDNDLLKYKEDDGKSIEPEWYVPIIPMVLVNGAEGIGTGWSTSIPNHSPQDIIDNLLLMIDGDEPKKMIPWYMGYKGSITALEGGGFSVIGSYVVHPEQLLIEIKDLTPRKWTEDYKKFLRNAMSIQNGQRQLISNFEEISTDISIHFKIHLNEEQMVYLQEKGVGEALKLTAKISTGNMVLIEPNGTICRHDSVESILKTFYPIRLQFYRDRRANIIKKAEDEMLVLDNKARFILAVIEDRIVIARRKKADVERDLETMGFTRRKPSGSSKTESEETPEEETDTAGGYDYLLHMQLLYLTMEKAEKLEQELEKKKLFIRQIRETEPIDMWKNDLIELRKEHLIFYDAVMEAFSDVMANTQAGRNRLAGARGRRGRGRRGGGRSTENRDGRQTAATTSSNRRGGGRRGGRGRQSVIALATSNQSADNSLVNHLDDVQPVNNSSVHAGASRSIQPMPFGLGNTVEGDGAASPPRPMTKRKQRPTVMSDPSSEEEETMLEKEPRPKRNRPLPRKLPAESVTSHEDADGLSDVDEDETDSDFEASDSGETSESE